ncbi:DUF3618 domain-containing protein [Cellulomonas edaphi]|uniref:DUF3618 domain-containing protein n=1 Tax=Cellulomonas edaphi TaxID=3053468 RepID=A0ABT7S7V9_9CELL|nr:DUF3618 domain-containing protein [Cellulomons edaphi]MDM7831609.1 DUF3618 domain-containing protein [Cellulomons edaphi]
MSTDPDQIRSDIESTRAELSADVDALTDKVNPTHVAQRQAERLRSTATRAKDRVMGAVSDAGSSVGSAAGSVGESAGSLPQTVKSRAEGSPLAAGLIAFGAGLLVAALLPSTRPEQQAAQAVKEQSAPMVDEVKGAAQEAAHNLAEPAKDAASAVQERTTQAVSAVKDEGQSGVEDVRSRAAEAKDTVQESAQS